MISAITVLGLVARSRRTVGELVREVPLDPQLQATVSVPFAEGPRLMSEPAFQSAIDAAVSTLAQTGGRVVVRLSGTEPLLRIMAEGPDRAAVAAAVDRLIGVAASLVGER